MSDMNELNELLRKERLEQEAAEKLERVMSMQVLGATPASVFFSSLLMGLERKVAWDEETGYTDGKRLGYNPEWVTGLTDRAVLWFLCHEAMHKGLGHHARLEDRDLSDWNTATDGPINEILASCGMDAPPGILRYGRGPLAAVPKGADLSAEQVYDLIHKPPPPPEPPPEEQPPGEGDQPQQDEQPEDTKDAEDQEDESQEDAPEPDDGGNPGDEEDEPSGGQDDPEGVHQTEQQGEEPGEKEGEDGNPEAGDDPGKSGRVVGQAQASPADVAEQQTEAAIALAAAYATAKLAGNLPGALERAVKEFLAAPYDPWERLRSYMHKRAKVQTSWDRFNRRLLPLKIYLPGRGGRTLGKLVIAVDTSGSIDDDILAMFCSNMQAIIELYPKTELTIVYADSHIQHVQHWTPTDGPLQLEARGGGGTSHRPVFEWVEKNAPDTEVLVCLTDLYTSYPDKKPGYDVLWATVGGDGQKAPWGVTVELDKTKEDATC